MQPYTIYDDVMSYEQNMQVYEQTIRLPFYYGEAEKGNPPTGMVFDIKDYKSDNFKFFDNIIKKVDSRCKTIGRAYINLFFSCELPYFHTDGNCITCLFYITPKYDYDEGGETQLLIDNNIIGIRPIPSRLLIFDGNVMHKATSYRSKPRLTVAFKYHKE